MFGAARARAIKAGVPEADLPPKPELDPGLQWIWRAWHRLSGDRPWIGGGMSAPVPGNIPWSIVNAWAREHDMPKHVARFLDQNLVAMDQVYMEHWRAGQKTSGNAGAQSIDDKLARFDAVP